MSVPLLILASNSPRRRELLALLGLPFIVRPVPVDESPLAGESPRSYTARIVEKKAQAAQALNADGALLICADTIVADGERILGKPASAEEARSMLQDLRGRTHTVLTGLSVAGAGRICTALCVSDVRMRNYSPAEVETYVSSGDPLDKAGAYAIQNAAFHPVEGFGGCMASVMGFPLCHLVRILAQFGVNPAVEPVPGCRRLLNYQCPISRRVLDGEEIG